MIIPIDDPQDARVAAYRQVRERDLVGRQGRFIAEGRVVLEKAIAAGRRPLESLLLAQNRLEGMAPLLALLPAATPVYAASQAVMDAVAGFHIHRGVLATGLQCDEEEPGALIARLPAQALVVVLAGIANHDNMGGAFRNAAAFGADAVLLDASCCDPLYRKAIRVSVGATLTVPFARAANLQALLARLAVADFEVLALSPGGQRTLADLPTGSRRTAALIGAEGPGLPADILSTWKAVRIEMTEGFDSLNLATAAGIFLHHLRNRPVAG